MAAAKKDNVQETTQETTQETVKNTNKEVKYLVEVTANPSFCGIGAGGVQFANGKATIGEGTLVNWFKEHKGYKVTKVTE